MIQVETSMISGNCNAWRNRLKVHRDKLNECQVHLQEAAGRRLTSHQLQDVEQLHNQFHIQLVNIHDLKLAIRVHLKKADYEFNTKNGHLNDDTLAEHEVLLERYSYLEQLLQGLQDRFRTFLARLS